MFSIYDSPLLPYVRILPDDSEDTVRKSAQQQAELQLSYFIRYVNPRDPEIPTWVDPTEPKVALNRIHSMLEHLRYMVHSVTHNKRDDAMHQLIIVDREPKTASTPLLLAIHAILHSHAAWTKDDFHHDIHSAVKTEKLLSCVSNSSSYPEWVVRWIVVLIGMKNLYRTCINEGEIAVWQNQQLSFKPEKIVPAIAQILNKAGLNGHGTEALSLVAESYEARSGQSVKSELFKQFTESVKDAMGNVNCGATGVLIAFEFGRYVFSEEQKKNTLALQIVRYLNGSTESSPAIIWLSFGRYWGTHHSRRLAEQPNLCECFKEYGADRFESFLAVLRTSTNFYKLDLTNKQDIAFSLAFGEKVKENTSVWERIELGFKNFLEHRQNNSASTIPWAYLMRELQILAHIYHEEFFELRILRSCSPSTLGNYNQILLPKEVPVKEEFGDPPVPNNDWHNPKLLVARCLATLVSNQRMAFGTARQSLEADEPEATISKWWDVSKWVADQNKHEALDSYLEKCLAPRVEIQVPTTHSKQPISDGEPIVVGFDIGGQEVKVARFKYNPDTALLGERIGEAISIPTQRETEQYADAKDFVSYLDEKLKTSWGNDWAKNLVAIGVAWPGAVAGSTGLEYVASYSSTLQYFQPFTKKFWNAKIEDIHKLRIREEFRDYYNVKAVTLMNDGVAHIIHESRQFEEGGLSPGETQVVLVVGTSTAMAVLDSDIGQPIKVIAELGRHISDIGCPFSTDKFPVGSTRQALNKDILSQIAWGILPTTKDTELVQGILIGWILADIIGDAKEKRKIVRRWAKEKHIGKLSDRCKALRDILDMIEDEKWEHQIEEFDWPNNDEKPWLSKPLSSTPRHHIFAQMVAYRAGQNIADVVALISELFSHSKNIFVGGGVLSDSTGKFLRNYAREELRRSYGFDVVEDVRNIVGVKPHLARLLRFPEPQTGFKAPAGPSGARGAAIAVTWLLSGGKAISRPKEPRITPRSDIVKKEPSFSTFSVLELGKGTPGKLLFQGRDNLPEQGTAGYVRSTARAKIATKLSQDKLAWRDYDDSVLTPVNSLIKAPYERNNLIISARNTLNEWGYQVRLKGKWWRRRDDKPIDDKWPVIAVGKEGTHLLPLTDVETGKTDLVTGIPLVINSVPSKRSFLIASCSDMAHMYEVDPKGRLGPSEDAWTTLTEKWQQLKDQGSSENDMALQLEKLARELGVSPSRNLLHSILAQRSDGSLVAFAITGALDSIAAELAHNWRVQRAVLLDNGGSVGWVSCLKDSSTQNVLVSGPNYRNRGTVFIDLWPDGFIHPREHRRLHGALV